MRINKFIAGSSGLSRRVADTAIDNGRVTVNGQQPQPGHDITQEDIVTLDGKVLKHPTSTTTIMLNKPVGYVCSREGQGSRTVYDLLPAEYHSLKTVGRLDKDSTGLLLLTSDGNLANELTHPRYIKEKVYEIKLDKPLTPREFDLLARGVSIENYISHLRISPLGTDQTTWCVAMTQGKNRQIRRTFDALGFTVTKLHRTQFGDYRLGDLAQGRISVV